jgi:Tol biopolymer transport system component
VITLNGEKSQQGGFTMNRKKEFIPILIIFLSALIFTASGFQNSSDHKVLFEKAKYTMETKGDLSGAIELFQEVIQNYPDERDYAAKSQYYVGLCFEKLGQTQSEQAKDAFQKVVDNYPEQKETVYMAREKLMKLTRIQTFENRFHMRRIWQGSRWWRSPSISPFGEFLVFADRMNSYGDVAVYDLSSGEIRRITSDATETEGAYECVVSPDGRLIAYGWLNNEDGSEELRMVGIDGSKPVVLYKDENGVPMAPADWSPDGKEILVYHKGIAMVSVDDGSMRILKKSNPKYLNGRMRISPDGRYIAYDWPPEGDNSSRNIYILAADGSYNAPLIEKPSNDVLLDWCPDGKDLLFRSDRTGTWDAWRIRFKEGKTAGPAVLIKQDLGAIEPLGFMRNGTFFFMSSYMGMDIYTARIDLRTGKVIEEPEMPIERGVGKNVSAAWSPDGKYLAYISEGSIHVRSEKTGEEKEISPQPGFYGLEWFPDGSSFKVYGEDIEGKRGLFRVDIETGIVDKLLIQTHEAPLHRVCLGPMGKNIYFSSYQDSENLSSIFAYDIQLRKKMKIWSGEGKAGRPVPSPDGRWLATEIQLGSESVGHLAVMSIRGGEMRDLAESSSGNDFTWTPDSKQILFAKFVAGSGWGSSHQELWIVPLSGGVPKNLHLESRMMWLLTIHPDGDRIAYTSDKSKAEIWAMENFLPEEKAQTKFK